MALTPKAARVNRGLTQIEVAQLMGVAVGTVQRLETNVRRARADYIIKFAEVVGADPNDLMLSAVPSKTRAAEETSHEY